MTGCGSSPRRVSLLVCWITLFSSFAHSLSVRARCMQGFRVWGLSVRALHAGC